MLPTCFPSTPLSPQKGRWRHPKKKEKTNKNKRWRTRSPAIYNTCHPRKEEKKKKKLTSTIPLTNTISCCLQHLCHPEEKKKAADEHSLLLSTTPSVTRKKAVDEHGLLPTTTPLSPEKNKNKKNLTNTIFYCLQHLCQPKKAADEHSLLLYNTSVPQKPPLTNTISCCLQHLSPEKKPLTNMISCCLQSRVYSAILRGSVGWVGSVLHPFLHLKLDVIGAAVVIRGSDVAVRDVIGLLLIRRFIGVAGPFIPGEIPRLGGREIIFLGREINNNVIKQKHLEARIRPPPPVTIRRLVTDHFREDSHHWGQPSRKLCWPTGRKGQNNNKNGKLRNLC